MESLYLLIPLSAGLVLVLIAVFGWALHGDQFEDLEREGERILQAEAAPLDAGQGPEAWQPEESRDRTNVRQ